MISNDDLHEEIDALEVVCKEEKDTYKRAALKAAILQIKLAHNNRTNLVRIMEKLGAEKVKPKARPDEVAPTVGK